MNPVETYFRDLSEIRSTGANVPETSFYGALEKLLNEIGKTLKPKVRCVLQLANRGAGNPDGGLFTANQFQKGTGADPIPGQMPERGVIEVKPTTDDAWVTASGKQVSRYWGKYGLVLVTNYRDFVLIGKDAAGNPIKLETLRLAETEQSFWTQASHPRKAAEKCGERFVQYLTRMMLHAAPLGSPEDVAWFLASYARDAKARIENVDLPALLSVREALEEALGLKFEGRKGEHFFRSTLVQTLFYGIFSAWVLWSKEHPPMDRTAKFGWKEAAWSLHVPMIRALFEQVAAPTRLKPLGLVEPLDWTEAVLNRVDRASFFSTFEEGQAVQYFYEPFLQQFDPELRKDLGVWYTPPEIVKYMVARVDSVLREELEIEDGLADPRVYVLDPCCGTGTYLVEVLRRIAETLKVKGGDGLAPLDLKKAAVNRVFGFEIMPAPFVVAHLQVGLLLQHLGAPLRHEAAERAAVYLTNSLTGWEPPKGPKTQLSFREMEEERDAAEEIKREKPILVILGNPPYNAFAGVSPKEEQGLVEPYKEKLNKPVVEGGWGIKKFNLDDLYIRFFRLAERRIAEMTGKGVVCFISNHSWISDPSFVVLRKHLYESFDRFWIENLHGNRKISEYAPDGRTSETIFALSGFSPGIQQGVATSLWVKNGKHENRAEVLFRDDLQAAKAAQRRAQLLESLEKQPFDSSYERSRPSRENRFSFRPASVDGPYRSWPKLTELCSEPPVNGLMEKRGGALIDIDRESLEKRMRTYYDTRVEWDSLKSMGAMLTSDAARFDARNARSKLLAAETFDHGRIRRFAVRPFDHRWCYYSGVRPLWNEPRPSFWAQCWEDNAFLMTRPAGVADPEGPPIFFTKNIGDNDFLRGHAYYFPVMLKRGTTTTLRRHDGKRLGEDEFNLVANMSVLARKYLKSLEVENPDGDAKRASLLWMHTLAIGCSPAYLNENEDGIRQDWPRIPLPASREVLEGSARLGHVVAALLDIDGPVKGVTSGTVRTELRVIGPVKKIGEGKIDPGAGDLDLTAGWGHRGKGGVVMPAKGKAVRRDYEPEELAAIRQGAVALGLAGDDVFGLLGRSAFDVYLNGSVCWRNIPENVWGFHIGGYQVIKKWLSYREREILGRGLTSDEVRGVTGTARRIAAILLLQKDLDRNYDAVKSATFPFRPDPA